MVYIFIWKKNQKPVLLLVFKKIKYLYLYVKKNCIFVLFECRIWKSGPCFCWLKAVSVVSVSKKGFYLLLPEPFAAARNDKLGQNNGRNDVLCPGGVRKFGILQA